MLHLTKIFPKKVFVANTSKINCNTIILPDYFLPKIDQLCYNLNEVAGFVICKKQLHRDFICYIVEHLRLTTEGNTGSVYPSKIVLMTLPDEYSAIEFHVHPSCLGTAWENKFSHGDYDTLAKRINSDSSYKHILFTSSNILTFGIEKPDLIISKSSKEATEIIKQREQYWLLKQNKQIPL